MRIRKKTILYAASVLACGNVILQLLAFVYRIMLSHFAGPEGLGIFRLVNSAYLVLHGACLSGVTMACSRISAAGAARGEQGKISAALRLAFRIFAVLCLICFSIVLFLHDEIAVNLLGDGRCAKAFPFLVLCLALTGIENIFKSFFIGMDKMQFTAVSEVCELLIRMVAVGALLFQYEGNDLGTIAMLIFAGMVISEIFSSIYLYTLFRKNMRNISKSARTSKIAGQFLSIAIPVSA